jgi:hypothetical protein
MTRTQFNAMRISLRNRKATREFVRQQKNALLTLPVAIPSAAEFSARNARQGQENPLLEGRGHLFNFAGLVRFCLPRCADCGEMNGGTCESYCDSCLEARGLEPQANYASGAYDVYGAA